MKSFFRKPFDDVIACLEPIMTVRSPFRAVAPMLVVMLITWFIYVPIHELLHVAGCVWSGGEVSRLELSARYGGTILPKFFPFIVSGSDYAGQLTGFDTKGSDLIYLATDFLPFALTVLIGVPFLHMCIRRRRPMLFGVAIVVGLAPFYNIPGDYYEMGSIITTRVCTWITGSAPVVAFETLRSDDIFTLLSDLFNKPAELGFEGAGAVALAYVVVGVGLIIDVLLAFLTYFAGGAFARLVVRGVPVVTSTHRRMPARRRRKRPTNGTDKA